MENKLNRYITSTCVIFTIVMVLLSLYNVFNKNPFFGVILYSFVGINVIQLISFAIGSINFTSYVMYHLINYLSSYIGGLIFFALIGFISLTLINLIVYTVIFSISYVLVTYYIYKQFKIETDKLNESLQRYHAASHE